MLYKYAAIALAILAAYGYGRYDGTRLTRAEHTEQQLSIARNELRAIDKLQDKWKAAEDELHAKNKALDTRLRGAIAELRNRPSRPAASEATAPERKCEAATGAELSREDAAFLVREAARANRVVNALALCQREYEELRSLAP